MSLELAFVWRGFGVHSLERFGGKDIEIRRG